MNINKFFPYLSIRSKLLIAFVALSVTPLMAFGWYGIRYVPRVLTERALTQSTSRVALKARSIERFLAEVQRDVVYLARSASLQDLIGVGRNGDPDRYDRARRRLAGDLVHFSQGKRAYYQVRYLDDTGHEVVRLNYDGQAAVIVPDAQLQDKSDRYYFREAMPLAAGEIYVSPMDLNVEFGRVETPPQAVVRYATPVRDQASHEKGIVIINIFATHLFALVENGDLPSEDESFLFGPEKTLFYHGKAGRAALSQDAERRDHISDYYPPEIVSQLMSPQPAAILGPDGVLAHVPIQLLDGAPPRFWILAQRTPREALVGPVRRMETLFLTIFSGVLVIAGAVGVVAARQFSQPIVALRNGAAIMARGDFAHRIQVETNDEIEDLAKQFNEMAAQLGESVRKMERWNEKLHEEVARRTLDLRSSEEKLRIENRKLDDIISGIGAELFLVDRSLNIMWANRSLLERHGGPSHVLGRPYFRVYGESEGAIERGTCLAAFQQNRMQSAILELGQGDEHQYYQVVSTPVVDESGRVFQVLELRLDITDSVLRDRAVRKQAAENEKLEALVQLSAGVIHEVANPLAAIRTTIDVIEKELTAGKREHFAPVKQKIEDLGRFLRTFSVYAKPRTLELDAADIVGVLQSVVRLLQDEATKRRILIVESYEKDLPAVQANPPQLQQVFLNLMINAFEAIPETGQVSITAQGQSDGTVTVTVADTGVGIASDQLGRIFDPFFSTKPSGTGLGLAIVRQVLKAHGAELEVESRPGSGTEFTIYFPSGTRTAGRSL